MEVRTTEAGDKRERERGETERTFLWRRRQRWDEVPRASIARQTRRRRVRTAERRSRWADCARRSRAQIKGREKYPPQKSSAQKKRGAKPLCSGTPRPRKKGGGKSRPYKKRGKPSRSPLSAAHVRSGRAKRGMRSKNPRRGKTGGQGFEPCGSAQHTGK